MSYHKVDWDIQLPGGMVRRHGDLLQNVLNPGEKPIAVWFWSGGVRSPMTAPGIGRVVAELNRYRRRSTREVRS
jgi:hypothetical protein